MTPKDIILLLATLLSLQQLSAAAISSSSSKSPVCFSEGRYPDGNDCGQYYDCIRNHDGNLIDYERSCYGNYFEASTQNCVSSPMVNGCSTAQYKSLRSNTIEYPDLQKLCSNFKTGYVCADCHTLVMCIDYQAYTMACENGSACNMNKEGFSGGVCHLDIPDDCNCTNQDSLKIDLYDPTKFINCSDVETVIKSCSEGSVFNNETQSCETLQNACSTSGRGTYADANDCSKYFTCSLSTNGWAQKWISCPRNDMYNQDTQKCENPCEWHYGNFTCKIEGRFSNPIDCSTYYECLKNPLQSEKFIQLLSMCPEGYEWSQDIGQCMATETLKTKCIPLTPKPNACIIPAKKCRSKALSACVDDHEFCECQDDGELTPSSPIQCSPCPEGHASNTTGCFPMCSELTCGDNETCSDANGQSPGTCYCTQGYVREGELCKALCSNMTCGENEICRDVNGLVPGACTCAQGYALEGELCKALCSNMTCGENEVCRDENGLVPGACTCAQGYARDGELCKDICDSEGGVHIGSQCLVFVDTQVTWIEAVMACGAKGQQLASIQNMTALTEYMSNNWTQWTYVGASDEGTEGNLLWLDGREMENGLKWHGNGQSAGGTGHNCGMYHPSNGMYPYPCTGDSYKKTYVCSLDTAKPPPASANLKEGLMRTAISPKQCPGDSFKVKDECFFIPKGEFKTWSNAQASCSSEGGFLAEPNSIADFLEALTNIGSGYNYWVGNVKIEDERTWSWNSVKEKVGGCQLLMRGETLPLYKANCEDYHLFVCEKY